MFIRSMPGAIGCPLMGTLRISLARPRVRALDGDLASNRPGRSRAGSECPGGWSPRSDDAAGDIKPSISDEHLVQGLLALVMSTAEGPYPRCRPTASIHRRNDNRRVGLWPARRGRTRCSYPDEHLPRSPIRVIENARLRLATARAKQGLYGYPADHRAARPLEFWPPRPELGRLCQELPDLLEVSLALSHRAHRRMSSVACPGDDLGFDLPVHDPRAAAPASAT